MMSRDINDLLADIDSQQMNYSARLKEEQDKLRSVETEKQVYIILFSSFNNIYIFLIYFLKLEFYSYGLGT